MGKFLKFGVKKIKQSEDFSTVFFPHKKEGSAAFERILSP